MLTFSNATKCCGMAPIGFFILIYLFTSCPGFGWNSPPATVNYAEGYDLAHPKQYILDQSLHEISGITFLNKTDHELGAIEDENGKLYYFYLGNGKLRHSKFSKKGDYEDVTLFKNEEIVVLRSDGSLFQFPLSQAKNDPIQNVREYKHLLPIGEYEGLCADGDLLFVLCKNCPNDNQKKEVSAYRVQRNKNGALYVASQFRIDLSAIHMKKNSESSKFHPSCLARHPLTGEWYVISSVNKLLVILDAQWKLKTFYLLDPVLFKQPEGLTFDEGGNMYVSNEGVKGTPNILVFNYNKNEIKK